jgi:hypothetical protein
VKQLGRQKARLAKAVGCRGRTTGSKQWQRSIDIKSYLSYTKDVSMVEKPVEVECRWWLKRMKMRESEVCSFIRGCRSIGGV